MVTPKGRTARLKYLLLQRLNNDSSLETGFTLTELLVVIIIVSVLFGIAAPGWFGLMSRQRINGAKTEVLQAMREAQNLAITRRRAYNVEFSTTEPRVSIFSGDGTNNVNPINSYTVGQRDGGEAEVELETFPAAVGNSIVFEFDGSIRESNPITTTSDGSIYKVVVSPDNVAGPRSCVIVNTLLGSMSEGNGDDCDA